MTVPCHIKPDNMSNWACETESLQAPWVVKVGLLLSLQQRGEGGWRRGGCKDHFYKLQHSFIITNFLNHTKISSIKWAAAKQTGRCTFRWGELTHSTCRKLDIASKADPQNRFSSSGSISIYFNKILHLTECDVCRLTPHWSSSRPALVTDNGDSGQQNIQTPPSIFRSCFSTQLCLPCQHPTVVLMLHTTTEFIWSCLYRAINMKMIATQEWNMEHKLAIMLIV